MKSWKTTAAGVGAILVAVGSALTATFDTDRRRLGRRRRRDHRRHRPRHGA